jgi:hypothetical protein
MIGRAKDLLPCFFNFYHLGFLGRFLPLGRVKLSSVRPSFLPPLFRPACFWIKYLSNNNDNKNRTKQIKKLPIKMYTFLVWSPSSDSGLSGWDVDDFANVPTALSTTHSRYVHRHGQKMLNSLPKQAQNKTKKGKIKSNEEVPVWPQVPLGHAIL